MRSSIRVTALLGMRYSTSLQTRKLSLDLKPPEIAQQCYRLIHQVTGNGDPFLKAKAEANGTALAFYPYLKETVANSEDPLFTACKLAIAGNSIDLGPSFDYGSLEDIVETALVSPPAINHYQTFLTGINNSRLLLYLGRFEVCVWRPRCPTLL